MVPGPSSPNTRDRYLNAPQDTESQLAKLAQEEGVNFINYLLAKAVADVFQIHLLLENGRFVTYFACLNSSK
jgi:hypothetical protein